MLFNSEEFLFVFLPATLIGFIGSARSDASGLSCGLFWRRCYSMDGGDQSTS